MFCRLLLADGILGVEALYRQHRDNLRRPVKIWQCGPVAQVDRAMRFERRGWEFKSLRVRQHMSRSFARRTMAK